MHIHLWIKKKSARSEGGTDHVQNASWKKRVSDYQIARNFKHEWSILKGVEIQLASIMRKKVVYIAGQKLEPIHISVYFSSGLDKICACRMYNSTWFCSWQTIGTHSCHVSEGTWVTSSIWDSSKHAAFFMVLQSQNTTCSKTINWSWKKQAYKPYMDGSLAERRLCW